MKLNSFEKNPIGKTTLNHIIKKATLIIKLDRVVKGLVTPILKSNLRVANYRHHILIIEVTNAAWLTRLNYERADLLSALRAQLLPGLIAINLKINPSIYAIQTSKLPTLQHEKSSFNQVPPMSRSSAALLNELANKGSPNLKARLSRLTDLAQSLPKH